MRPTFNSSPGFSTRDINIATVLKLSGIRLIKVLESNGRGIFVFETSEQVEDLINQYINGELRIDPKAFVENWKALKSLAYSTVNNMG